MGEGRPGLAAEELRRKSSACNMESLTAPWSQRLDKQSRLLLCTLMSGHWGALSAFRALQRSQSGEEARQGFNWQIFTQNLCSQEPVLEGPKKTLILKPLLLLLPVLCQRNLFSLLLTLQSVVPKGCLSRLVQVSRQDPCPDPWVQRLRDFLEVGLQEKTSVTPVLLSDACQQELKDLCQKVMAPRCSNANSERKLSWYIKPSDPCLVPSGDTPVSGSQVRKSKKVTQEHLGPEEGERARKRSRIDAELDVQHLEGHAALEGFNWAATGNELMMEVSGNEYVESLSNNVYQTSLEETVTEKRGTNLSPEKDIAAEVPDHIKAHVPKLKEQLEMQLDHSDGIAPPELQILNDCTPRQLEGLCSLLQLSECPDNELLHFCTWLMALSPDLGYSNAAIFAAKLFLPRVLSLTEPASWPLTTALMMFSSKYSRPICCTLISSIVQAPEKGREQIKLVCKLIEECLEPEYMQLIFSHIIEVPWSEDLLTIVHSLLERQVELSTEFFNVLVINLCQMSQEFAKSMQYAKLVLTVLTKYQNNPPQKQKDTGDSLLLFRGCQSFVYRDRKRDNLLHIP
ncbi:Fanconi anemia group E protein isoform X1 [Pogona vitticeps]